jgi:hypothetical protein
MIWLSNGVVYDESDEAALPTERQSDVWKRRSAPTELSCGTYDIRPVGGHFYIADFAC